MRRDFLAFGDLPEAVLRRLLTRADTMTHPACQMVPAKAFLLHAQNALLEWVFTPE